MPIASMDNKHLKNTILLIIDTVKKNQRILNTDYSNVDFNNLDLISTEIDYNKLKRNAKETIKCILKYDLPFYVMESAIRWMDLSKELQELYNRKKHLDSNFIL